MNNLITPSIFVNSIFIPVTEFSEAELTSYIAECQKEVLIMLLGYDLYLQFETGLAETEPEPKWVKLRDGSNEDLDGIKVQNVGVKPIIANYVYCKWVSDKAEQTTIFGTSKTKIENAEIISSENKLTGAWNQMVKYYLNVANYIFYNQNNYQNWDPKTLKLMTYGF